MAPVIVDDQVKLEALLATIAECVQKENDHQLLFVDLEGVNLGRSGTVAIMQLLVPPSPTVYLIDIHVLGATAFQTTSKATSLKTILECKTMFKVFFDIRQDSDALYSHFGIKVAGIIDLQILEYATRWQQQYNTGRATGYLNGLSRCIQRDLPKAPETDAWLAVKQKGLRLFSPDHGGKYEVFLHRPLTADIVKYCEQDLVLMPSLLQLYGPKLRQGVASQIQTIVDDRIRTSQAAQLPDKGRHMAVGPYIDISRAGDHSMNMSLSPQVRLVCSADRLSRLCRLDTSPTPKGVTNELADSKVN